jgi:hypothetical protein
MASPAKVRDETTGEVWAVDVAEPVSRLGMFVWESADLSDWHDLYIPGEWPEWKDERTGEVLSAAQSKNFIQEKIMRAENWPEHPLAAVAKLGPDSEAPTPEELEKQNCNSR